MWAMTVSRCKMVFGRGGLYGLRALLSAGMDPGTIVARAARVLGIAPAELDPQWRKQCGVK